MSIRATILAGFALVGISLSGASFADSRSLSDQQIWLNDHNAARADFGVGPLEWNSQLANEAREWAQQLAREGVLRHSSNAQRARVGENLWMGTAGYFRADQMLGPLIDEKRYFTPGQFPRVSRTGNWMDVGHYTQIVWAETREVGCATARGRQFDVLVCRYWPGGNVLGTHIAPRERVARR